MWVGWVGGGGLLVVCLEVGMERGGFVGRDGCDGEREGYLSGELLRFLERTPETARACAGNVLPRFSDGEINSQRCRWKQDVVG